MEVVKLDPKRLVPNKFNSNVVPPDNLEKLKRSIRELGFSSAVVCRELEDGTLEILGGEHRTKAAVEMGLEEVPVLVLQDISDDQAKKISLVDNQRYGNDDSIMLADIIKDVGGVSELIDIMPASEADLSAIMKEAEVDFDTLGLDMDDDEDTPDDADRPAEKPARTHDLVKFRMTLRDAELVRQKIEKTISREGLSGEDDMTSAGNALALLLLGKKETEE